MPEFVSPPKEVTGEADRKVQGEKALHFLDKIGAKEAFGSEAAKRAFIATLDFEGFKDLLVRVNGLLRDIPQKKRSMDGRKMILEAVGENKLVQALEAEPPTGFTPRDEDKDDLFREMFTNTKEMALSGASMEDIALLVSTGINAIHGFKDGNGRTSRLTQFLLSEDYTGTPEQEAHLRKLLGDTGRMFVDMNPSTAEAAVMDYIFTDDLGIDMESPTVPNRLGSYPLLRKDLAALSDEKAPKEIAADFKTHIIEQKDGWGLCAVYGYLREKGRLKEFTGSHTREEDGTTIRTFIDLPRLLHNLHPSEYTEILEEYWKFRKRSVSVLIGALAHPNDFVVRQPVVSKPVVTHSFQKDFTIKAYLQEGIDDKQRSLFQEVNGQRLWEDWKQREKIPFSTETISHEEIERLCDVRQKMDEIMKKDEREREALQFDYTRANEEKERREALAFNISEGDPLWKEKHAEARREAFEIKREIYKPLLDISERNFQEVLAVLEAEPMWHYKLSTRREENGLTDAQQETTDSLYFVTKNGVSIRLLKYALAEEGLKEVIQPFFEKLFCLNADNSASDIPEVGKEIVEYRTSEFIECLANRTGEDFHSNIRRYEKDGKVLYLNPVDGSMHKGYPIQKVFTS